MKIILQDDKRYVLRFFPGEELIEGLAEFCGGRNIEAAAFSAIGMTEGVTLSYYDAHSMSYQSLELKGRHEIASLTGNVGVLGERPIVHAHGVFSDGVMEAKGGHVKRLMVSATCEVALESLNGRITRKHSPDTGLNLME